MDLVSQAVVFWETESVPMQPIVDTDALATTGATIYPTMKRELEDLTNTAELNRFGRTGMSIFYCTTISAQFIRTEIFDVMNGLTSAQSQGSYYPCGNLTKTKGCGKDSYNFAMVQWGIIIKMRSNTVWVFNGRHEHVQCDYTVVPQREFIPPIVDKMWPGQLIIRRFRVVIICVPNCDTTLRPNPIMHEKSRKGATWSENGNQRVKSLNEANQLLVASLFLTAIHSLKGLLCFASSHASKGSVSVNARASHWCHVLGNDMVGFWGLSAVVKHRKTWSGLGAAHSRRENMPPTSTWLIADAKAAENAPQVMVIKAGCAREPKARCMQWSRKCAGQQQEWLWHYKTRHSMHTAAPAWHVDQTVPVPTLRHLAPRAIQCVKSWGVSGITAIIEGVLKQQKESTQKYTSYVQSMVMLLNIAVTDTS
ncbi:hypothetical protein C8J57DRAFT_1257848 [Mycena rebaudengoi]|nr:hypothetical protein C8J57DRAFT_1257848 [Mycena rebaudengoi]